MSRRICLAVFALLLLSGGCLPEAGVRQIVPQMSLDEIQPDDQSEADLAPDVPDREAPDATEEGTDLVSGEVVPEASSCLAVNPEAVNFGEAGHGGISARPLEISSCGEAPLEIHDISIAEGSSPKFDLDLESLGVKPSVEEPLVMPAGKTVYLNVLFAGGDKNPWQVDAEGNLILDEGTVVISSNSPDLEKLVPLSGLGPHCCCPTGVIKCEEGDEVIPQTVLHLHGDESYADCGEIVEWEWEVDQPAGSQSVFVPSNTAPNTSFEANVAGVYTFYLRVYDEFDGPTCFPASYEVVVIPDEALHIELLWHTPEDPDETDTGPEAGSDLDLHFLHPWAAGPDLDGDGAPDGWFDIPFDCFWFNSHPNWGSYDPSPGDDPGLDRDDTDGAGPENINLDTPENMIYRVGVHYWNDYGYEASYATVRVYIYAQLVFEVADVQLFDLDMWEVATIEWPLGEVHVVADDIGQYKITPNYVNPFFFQ